VKKSSTSEPNKVEVDESWKMRVQTNAQTNRRYRALSFQGPGKSDLARIVQGKKSRVGMIRTCKGARFFPNEAGGGNTWFRQTDLTAFRCPAKLWMVPRKNKKESTHCCVRDEEMRGGKLRPRQQVRRTRQPAIVGRDKIFSKEVCEARRRAEADVAVMSR